MKIDLSKSLREWQKDYIRNKKRFNVLVVHRRAGKTVGAVLDIIIVMMQERGDYWYIAPTYRQAKKIAWRLIQKFWDQIWGFNYNSSELIVSFTNGSTLSLFGAENPDSLRGLDLKWVIFDEYAQQPSSIYGEIVFPMINANGWWVTWIGTPKGKNSFYQLYKRAKEDERFYTALLTYKETKLLSEEQIGDARAEMTPEEFEQEYMCSWDASIKWAVYGKELQLAHAEWRVRSWIYNPELEVTTFWDLGISDAMAIIFVQTVWQEIRIVDHYSNTGYWLEHYSEVLKQKGYNYKEHWFPHDIRHRELATGTSRIETAIKFLWKNCKIVPMNTIESGINAARLIFKNLWIEESLDWFINNVSLYQYELDEKLGIYKKQPKHDFTSHDADSLRYMATVYEHIIKIPSMSPIEEDMHEMDLLIFEDDEPDEDDETVLDNAF